MAHRTPRDIIEDVLAWAEKQNFQNIAAELHRALRLLPKDEPHKRPRRGKVS